jgi:hypothetical protein
MKLVHPMQGIAGSYSGARTPQWSSYPKSKFHARSPSSFTGGRAVNAMLSPRQWPVSCANTRGRSWATQDPIASQSGSASASHSNRRYSEKGNRRGAS